MKTLVIGGTGPIGPNMISGLSGYAVHQEVDSGVQQKLQDDRL